MGYPTFVLVGDGMGGMEGNWHREEGYVAAKHPATDVSGVAFRH